ncbi:anti-sigma factor [Bradyrhizobium roseum]|uniref:hypothetical protein n=1 Tax=Bradyrhizobium roseum TaxID=3056648 RepID=UPI00261EE0B3|nr:hypothetical protein [Bradyrhizobium roseus]WKA31150.1 hypothetical protein QUH67_13705 [Bradyrhizobium roseus]
MIERLSQESASVPDEDDGRSARRQMLELLRAHLSQAVSEGLEPSSVSAQWSEIDNAQIAAFLDGSLPRAEWDAVVARLVNDPASRAELSAAVALLDDIQAQPATVPAGLMGRAASMLAEPAQDRPSVSAATIAPASWYRRTLVWPGFALAILVVTAVPTVWNVVGGRTTAVEQGGSGDTFGRGIAVAPPSPTRKKDAQSCVDANDTPTPGAERRSETSAENDDRCRPKPPGAGQPERAAPARSN